jgi:hypothetical protein
MVEWSGFTYSCKALPMRARYTYILLLSLIAGLLAACGQPAAVVPTITPPPAPPTETPRPAPAADIASIPQGRTTDGYQALGAESAPVTLVMYSDFF